MQRDDYQATLIVMSGLGAASLTGFVRQTTIAHQLGAGRAADIYLVAFAVPEFVSIALPIVLSPALIPLFTEHRLRIGEAGAWRFGQRAAGAVVVAALLFAALAGLGAPLYVDWLAPGFLPSERLQAVRAARLMVPAIPLMGLATTTGAALSVYRRFARPALATAVYNLVFVAALLCAPLAWAVGRAAWGVTLGAVAALVFQVSLLWRHRPQPLFETTPEGGDESPVAGVRRVAALVGPLSLGYAVHHVILFVDRAMAIRHGVGSAAALGYAYHLALAIGQLSGLAVATGVFPRLAEQVAGGDRAGARKSLGDALRLVWMVGLPATCGLLLLRRPLVRVLFERGAFDPAATAAVSEPLVWYSVAVLADALCQPLWRVLYAQQRPWGVVAINGLQTVLRLASNLTLVPVLGHTGLALSATLGLSVQAVVLGGLAWRRLGGYLPRTWWRDASRVVLAAALAAGTVRLLVAWLSDRPAWVRLVAGGALGCLVYVGALALVGGSRLLWNRDD